MRQCLLNKVRRGEVFMGPSVGYVRSPNGGFDFDPDEQSRAVVRLVFDQFERLGTIRKVLRYLLTHDIRIGIRPHAGPNRGQLEWRIPTRDTVTDILVRPIYAGYYCFGRRQTDRRRRKPGQRGSGRIVVPRQEYLALIPDKNCDRRVPERGGVPPAERGGAIPQGHRQPPGATAHAGRPTATRVGPGRVGPGRMV